MGREHMSKVERLQHYMEKGDSLDIIIKSQQEAIWETAHAVQKIAEEKDFFF